MMIGPAHLAGHQRAHQMSIVLAEDITCQVEALHVLGVSHTKHNVKEFLSDELAPREINVE